MEEITFEPFPKIARLSRECVVTEKIDGTNAQVIVTLDGQVAAASRSRLITPADDNCGFARWVHENKDALAELLGPGRHFGEWWGLGIQRHYGLKEKRFSLFNTHRWGDMEASDLVSVVPTLYTGDFNTIKISEVLESLAVSGSVAAPGFMNPEGIVIYHRAADRLFKKTIEKDAEPKGRG